MKSVRFNRLAGKELWEAVGHYEAEREGLGGEFLDEISRALAFAVRFPKASPLARGSIRALVVARFPYSILYRVLSRGTLRVLAVAHHKRHPEYWQGRR